MSLARSSCLLILIAATARVSLATDYYVSPAGNDSNTGTSSGTPWASLTKASQFDYQPGDRLLLQRGGEWRGQLTIHDSGTQSNPIVIDAYGSGAKPKIWGSDIVANSSFKHVSGTTWVVNNTKTVNSFLANHEFYLGAEQATNSSPSELTKIAYVKSNPNSWYQTKDGKLYVNTGNDSPLTSSTLFTAAVRDDLVHVHNSEYITVRNLVADESAKDNAGYAFRSFQNNHVNFEDSEAYRAGKHHFGVINSNNFVGKNLYAAYAMPGQISASGYVSYSDYRRTGDTSDWENITGEHLLGDTFYTHGDPGSLARVTVKNIVGHGAGLGAATDPGILSVTGGLLDQGASILLNSDQTVIDGIKMGNDGYILVNGNNNILQNLVVKQFASSKRYNSVIDDHGTNNVVRFSTFDLSPYGDNAAISSVGANSNTEIYGNIFKGNAFAIMTWVPFDNGMRAHDNLYDGVKFLLGRGYTYNPLTPLDFAALGYDLNSITGNPQFVDWANGNFELLSNSPAIGYLDMNNVAVGIDYDFNGNVRGLTGYYNLGAFEGPISIPEPALLLPATAIFFLLRRR